MWTTVSAGGTRDPVSPSCFRRTAPATIQNWKHSQAACSYSRVKSGIASFESRQSSTSSPGRWRVRVPRNHPKTSGRYHRGKWCNDIERHFGAHTMIDIDGLTRDERLELLERLWDSLTVDPDAFPLTDAQREELDRRLDELDRDGPTGIPVEELLARLRSPTECSLS
jgi:putative addiction module component (TIGR02574 family)